MKRDNHYEAAFEGFLRARGVPYVAVDEAKRALADGESLKNLDFIVSAARQRFLIDVKGRLFPGGESKQYWKNWSTRDDLRGLARWQELFGAGFEGLFVFAYQVVGDKSPLPPEQLFAFRHKLYGFVGVRLPEYIEAARLISPKWDTVAMSARGFRALARPVVDLL